MSKINYRNDRGHPMSNGVKSEKELLKSRLQRLVKLLDYKNRNHCKKYLNGIIKEFFGEKNDRKQKFNHKR